MHITNKFEQRFHIFADSPVEAAKKVNTAQHFDCYIGELTVNIDAALIISTFSYLCLHN